MSEELKPCPSCSGKPFIDVTRSPMGIRYNSVTCKECGLATKFYCEASKQRAYDSWNARAKPTFTKEDAEKVAKIILDNASHYDKMDEFYCFSDGVNFPFSDTVKLALAALGRVEE